MRRPILKLCKLPGLLSTRHSDCTARSNECFPCVRATNRHVLIEEPLMHLQDLQDLYVEELRDIYSAEKQLIKALPKMAKKAMPDGLKQAFTSHLEETKGHVERLEQIFETLGKRAGGK